MILYFFKTYDAVFSYVTYIGKTIVIRNATNISAVISLGKKNLSFNSIQNEGCTFNRYLRIDKIGLSSKNHI